MTLIYLIKIFDEKSYNLEFKTKFYLLILLKLHGSTCGDNPEWTFCALQIKERNAWFLIQRLMYIPHSHWVCKLGLKKKHFIENSKVLNLSRITLHSISKEVKLDKFRFLKSKSNDLWYHYFRKEKTHHWWFLTKI